MAKRTETTKAPLQQSEALQIVALDRGSVEQGIRCRGPFIVVSIRDPTSHRPRIRQQVGLRDILYLAFHDAEPVQGFQLPKSIRLMNPKQATQIATFVTEQRNAISTIVVHCEQGMSRSPGVAAAVGHFWNIPVQELIESTQPNPYVYRLVLEAMKKVEARNLRERAPTTRSG